MGFTFKEIIAFEEGVVYLGELENKVIDYVKGKTRKQIITIIKSHWLDRINIDSDQRGPARNLLKNIVGLTTKDISFSQYKSLFISREPAAESIIILSKFGFDLDKEQIKDVISHQFKFILETYASLKTTTFRNKESIMNIIKDMIIADVESSGANYVTSKFSYERSEMERYKDQMGAGLADTFKNLYEKCKKQDVYHLSVKSGDKSYSTVDIGETFRNIKYFNRLSGLTKEDFITIFKDISSHEWDKLLEHLKKLKMSEDDLYKIFTALSKTYNSKTPPEYYQFLINNDIKKDTAYTFFLGHLEAKTKPWNNYERERYEKTFSEKFPEEWEELVSINRENEVMTNTLAACDYWSGSGRPYHSGKSDKTYREEWYKNDFEDFTNADFDIEPLFAFR